MPHYNAVGRQCRIAKCQLTLARRARQRAAAKSDRHCWGGQDAAPPVAASAQRSSEVFSVQYSHNATVIKTLTTLKNHTEPKSATAEPATCGASAADPSYNPRSLACLALLPSVPSYT